MESTPLNSIVNPLGQPIGLPLQWQPVVTPCHEPLMGNYSTLVPLNPARHASHLYQALCDGSADAERRWTYLPYGPFTDEAQFCDWISNLAQLPRSYFYVIENPEGAALGQFALTAVETEHGSAELAHVLFSAALQRSTAATEAVFLILDSLFSRGYRRCTWKCNALNTASRRAAQRFGFRFEGLFRNAMVVKGHNRDTAWYAITDDAWPGLRDAYKTWLAPENFDNSGVQKRSLATLTGNLP